MNESARPALASPPPPRRNWGRRLVTVAAVAVAVLVLALIAAAVVPRWWAHRVGDQADGSMTAGIGLGIFYGLVFTALPLGLLWLTLRPKRSRRVWLFGVLGAIVLALPNLMTLSIVVGTGNASHAGERILDVEAPSFRGASLVGAVLGALVIGFVAYQQTQRRRIRRKASRLEGELKAERAAREAAPSPESAPD